MSNLGIRLRQARKAAGLSLRALADRMQLSHAAIKKYEDEDVYPSSDILVKLAKILNVRVDFFFRPNKVVLENIKFRKRKKLSPKIEEAIKFDVINQIERRLELENLFPDLPKQPTKFPNDFPKKISSLDDLEKAAERLREHWRLGIAPIHDLIDVLESHSIRVFVVDSEDSHFDGLSSMINDEPIIVISSKWPGDRQRFTLLHELAHLILFNRIDDLHFDEELFCNRFAAAFLLPKESLFQSFGKKRRAIDLVEFLSLKEQFQLSMSAICHRLKDLEIISESFYNRLRAHFRKQGWNVKEPGAEILPEKAHKFTQMLFHALAEGYISEAKAAELLACTLSELREYR